MIRTFSVTLAVLVASPLVAAEPAAPRFESDIRPLLKAYCFECHGDEAKPKAGLDVRLSRLLAKGGDSGPALVPGKPAESLLITKIVDGDMPPGKKKLTAAETDLIRRWIAAGAKTEKPEPESLATGFQITADDRNFWVFRPVDKPVVPFAKTPMPEVRNPVDSFLLAKLQEKGLRFSPAADKATLVRRAYFDLIGLPPTPDDVDAFVRDRTPDAWEKLIDKLLASPQYGERWGRHWLDVAGYADSEGYSPADPVRDNAWRYRDYVIRSFNADKPYDQFVREQVAGDEMLKTSLNAASPDDLEKLTATGFLRMAPDGTGIAPTAEQTVARNQVIAETLKIVSSSFLGLTVGCAQCHNHRYDPISQADYYRLRAVFEPAYDLTAWKAPAARQVSLLTDEDKKKVAEIEAKAVVLEAARVKKQNAAIADSLAKEIAKLPEAVREKARAACDTAVAKRTPEQKKLMQAHPNLNVSAGSLYMYDKKTSDEIIKEAAAIAALRATKPNPGSVRALFEVPGKVPVTRLFHRGDPDQPKEAVAPGVLTVLDDEHALPKPQTTPTGSGRRTALAAWLTDPKNPLTARVLVNRVWHEHFGHGIVGTPGDFGRLGEKPTHPELLDWLAGDFTANGWSVKKLHRRIMTSTAYRQASRRDRKADTADPDNRLLGHFPLRRLDAEAVRDGILAVSGNLTPKMFGPPVPVKENEVGQIVLGIENRDGAGRFTAVVPLPAGEEFRRSVYVQVRRTKPLAMLDTFDWATTEPNCEARNSSTVTPQALMLLNGDFLQQQAEAFAARVMSDAGSDPRGRVVRAWKLAYGTAPTERDAAAAITFVKDMTATFAKAPPAPTPKDAKPVPAPKGTKPAAKPKEAKPAPTADFQALAAYCQTLLSSNRFLYVD